MWARIDALTVLPPGRRDALLAAGLGAVLFALQWPWTGLPPDMAGTAYHAQVVGTAVVGCTLLAWRRRYPTLVFAVLGVAMAATLVAHVAASWSLVVLAWIGLYGVAAYASPRRAFVTGWCVVLAAVGVVGYLIVVAPGDRPAGGTLPGILLSAAYLGSAWVFGRYRRTRRAYLAELHERAAMAEREHAAIAAEAAAEERAWIARELHDLLAHTLSGIVVLAGGARRAADPAAAVDTLGEIERTGRAGMAETRLLLDTLREEGDHAAVARPSLRELPSLVERMRAAGLPVELTVEGEPGTVPLAVELAAYRIGQEALTNTLRHAGPATARVCVRYLPDVVEVTVTDDGGGADGVAPGHGLAGMRERARLLGGELRAGPAAGGGWTVHTWLPRTGVVVP